MGRSNEERLWCIKIKSGKAFVHKGGKALKHFKDLISAKKSSATVSKSGKNVERDVVEVSLCKTFCLSNPILAYSVRIAFG